MTKDKLSGLLKAIVREFNADIYLVNSDISISLYRALNALFDKKEEQRSKNAFLILSTPGGSARAAFKIARMFQDKYSEFTLIVPDACKSAGTLLGIGAFKIIFGAGGELGPLDVQIGKEGEIVGLRSGLDIHYGIDRISYSTFDMFERIMLSVIKRSGGNVPFQTASKVACDLVRPFLEKTSEQISPLSLGETARAMRVGEAYGERLNSKFENLKNKEALNQLVSGYPEHGFVIDFHEAESLFNRVTQASGDIKSLISALGNKVYYPIPNGEGEAIPLVLCLNDLIIQPDTKEDSDEREHSGDDGGSGDNQAKETVPDAEFVSGSDPA